MSGPKSVVAPIPRKISGGKISHSIPLWNEYNSPKDSPFVPSLYRAGAKLTSNIPTPIGINRYGSKPLVIARYINKHATKIIINLNKKLVALNEPLSKNPIWPKKFLNNSPIINYYPITTKS